MEFCRFLRSVKFVVRSLGRFLGRGVCLWLQRSQGSLTPLSLLVKILFAGFLEKSFSYWKMNVKV